MEILQQPKIKPKDSELGNYHDLSDLAKITEADITAAAEDWKSKVPAEFANLINPKIDDAN